MAWQGQACQGLWAELPTLGKPWPEGQTLACTCRDGVGGEGATLHPIPTGYSTPKTRVAEGPGSPLPPFRLSL